MSERGGHTQVMPRGGEREAARLLVEAIDERRVVHIVYDDGKGERTARAIEPVGVLRLGETWTVPAWCRLRDDARVFRLDRIRAVRVTDEKFASRELTLEALARRGGR